MFSNDLKAVKTRLSFCFDLSIVLDQKKEGNLTEKALITLDRKAGKLRSLIAGESIPKHEILLTSSSSVHSYYKDMLQDYEAETDEAKKAVKLLKLKNFLDVQSASAVVDRTRILDLRQEVAQTEQEIVEQNRLIRGLVDHTIKHAKIKGVFDPSKSQALLDKEQSIIATYNEKYQLAKKELSAKYDEIRKPFNDFRDKMLAGMSEINDLDERFAFRDKHQKQLNDLDAEFSEKYRELKALLIDSLNDQHEADKAAIRAEKIAMAKVLKDAVIAQSTVTYADAEKWIAEKVTVTKAMTNKLKKNGISQEKFTQDLKDFFVITNGRLGKIKIDTKNHDRAYASGTTRHDLEGVVMMDNKFELAVLWHELAHHLEADDSLRLVAREYIKSRSLDGGKKHKLRNIAHKGYGGNEYAYNTDMYNHYVAKIYDHGTTEVFSMGVEALYNEEALFEIMHKDPKTLEFVTGALMQTREEVDLINQNLRDGILETNADAENLQADSYQEVVNKLAALVKFSFNSPYGLDDLTADDRQAFDEWGAEKYGTLELPNGKKLVLFKAKKVKYKSYRGRAIKGVFALDFDHYEAMKSRVLDFSGRYFAYGYGVNEQYVFAIQTQDIDKIRVMALSMDLHRRTGYSISDSKGNIGEGFMSFDKLDNLKKEYL